MLKKFLLICALFVGAILCSSEVFAAANTATEAQSKLEPLFRARKWQEIDQHVKKGNLSAHDRSIAANAYRLQERWADVVSMLGNLEGFPGGVAPYARMALTIALENLGRKDEALKIAESLRKNPAAGLGFYASYAVFRLSGNANVRREALSEMLARATAKDQEAYALEELLKIGVHVTENAKKLLGLDPSNSLAVKALSALSKPWGHDISLLLGHAAYLAKDNKRAAEILADAPKNRRAQYYRAFALYNSEDYNSALQIWSSLALSGNDYAASAANRISILSNRDGVPSEIKTAAKNVLKNVADTRKGTVQARALYSLGLQDRVLLEYPSTSFALKVLWGRGMKAWEAGNYKDALWHWQRANMPDMATSWGARTLYWTAKAQEKLGQKEAAAKTLNSLMSRYPLSVYTYLAKPGALKIVDSEPKALASQPTELERWGFLNYARKILLLDAKNAKNAYRAASISEWLGDDGGVYRAGLSLQKFFVTGMTASRQGLRLIYPRPYRNDVKKASERFGVEENFVWSIMKQESAFNPFVKSHAGATGLMQLMPGTAKGEAGLLKMQDFKIWNTGDNITLGASYLMRQLRSFGNPERAAAAYNAGPGNARKWNKGAENLPLELWIEKITFDETSDYVQRIMGNVFTYRLLYGGKPSQNLPPLSPDDEKIEAQRAKDFAGSFNDTVSTLREP